MTNSIQLNINGNFFYYSFNENSNFFDLLEYFSYIFPSLNICPCYELQFFNPNDYRYYDLDMETKVCGMIYFYKKYRTINKNNNCNCQFKDIFKLSKMKIIDEFSRLYNKINSLQNKIKNNEKIIEDYNNSENYLKNQNKDLIRQKDNLNRNISNLKEKLNYSENRIRNQDKEIQQLKIDNQNLNNNVKTLQNEKVNLENIISKILNKADSLENQKNLAKQEIKKLKSEMNNKDNKQKKNEQKIQSLESEKEKLIKERQENQKLNKEIIFTEFYDVIIDIKSIKDINKGWEVKMSENAKKNYENFKKEENLKVGIIGNANKGKSFLLSKISKIDLPAGTSIRTQGLSIKYPDLEIFKDRKIVLLDSAGLETPILKEDIVTNNENIEDLKEKEMFREKSREKLITELFLQNYIINNSDILIIVVGILTYSEQKLLNRIKIEFLKLRNKNKIDKPLFIIHNLMTYETVGQVEEYTNDYLLKSATFDLKKGDNISTKTEKKDGVYYYEKNINQKIFHLIYARENSEAGKKYNDFTLAFLENSYQNVINLKSYDVIESVKTSFIEISKDILEKTEQPLTIKNFEQTNDSLIKLTNANFALKKCLIDELGFSNLKANSFEPTYNYYKKDKNKLIIRLESPGNSEIQASFEHGSQYNNLIRITGTKKKDKEPAKIEDNIINYREYGNFSLDIPINPEEFIINSNKNPNISDKKGIFFIEYEIEDKKGPTEYKQNEEEEI